MARGSGSLAARDALPDRRRDRLKKYFGRLGRMDAPPGGAELDAHAGELTYAHTALLSPENAMYLFAGALLRLGLPEYVCFNVYDFVQMHWKTHPEHETYLYCRAECALVWGGYGEMENKSTQQMAAEFFTRRKRRGGTTIALLKRGQYRELEEYLEGAADSTVNLDSAGAAGRRDF